MWRWIAISLTSLAVLIGLWGAYEWSRSGPPPLGDISLESVTPPDTELSLRSQRYCDKAVPGFWAIGSSAMRSENVSAWFDSRFGPKKAEATARLNRRAGLTFAVYEDIHTAVRDDGATTLVWVMTYETASHHCLRRDLEPWDHTNAASFIDPCDKLIIDFWGVEYGADIVEDPAPDASIIDFAGGKTIAHGERELDIIHAKTGRESPWRRYMIGNACFLD